MFWCFPSPGYVLTAANCFCGGLQDCHEHSFDIVVPLPNRDKTTVTVDIGFHSNKRKQPIISFEARIITIYEGYQKLGDSGDLAVVELKSEHGIPRYVFIPF